MVIKEGYKQTEIGLIPNDWEVKNIGDVCQIFGRIGFRGYTVNDIVKKEQGAITISPSNIYDDKINFAKCTYISWFKYHESPEIKIFNGDVLLVKTGSTSGKTALVKNLNEKATINPQLVVLKKILINNFLLSYIMSYEIVQNQIISTIVGGAIPTLSQKQVLSFKIPLPPSLAEQTAIATALSDADGLITGLEKLISKKRNIKQGAMQQLLQPKEDWEVKKLGEVCLILNNLRIPIKESSRIKGETPYYGANGIQGYVEGFTHCGEFVLVAEDGANDLNNYPINYIQGKIWVNNHAHVLQGIASILKTSFLSYLLKSIDFQSVLVGGTRAKLNKSILDKIEFSFPSLSEQTRITTILSDMDAELSALEQKLEKYKKIKLGMMQELLTGKTRLV